MIKYAKYCVKKEQRRMKPNGEVMIKLGMKNKVKRQGKSKTKTNKTSMSSLKDIVILS